MKKLITQHVKEMTLLFSVIYLELIFHLRIFKGISFDFIYPLLFGISFVFFIHFIGQFFSDKINKIMTFIFLILVVLGVLIQSIYYDTFQVFTNLNSMFHGTGQIMEFKNEILDAIARNVDMILYCCLPLGVYGGVIYRFSFSKSTMRQQLLWISCSAILYLMGFLCLFIPHAGMKSTFDYYLENRPSEIVMNRFGLITTTRLQIREHFFVFKSPTNLRYVKAYEKEKNVRESLNQMEINFAQLKKSESNPLIKQLHSYFAGVDATAKNEYTGMFKDYNLIFITAEAFSDFAIDEHLTPTLYKMKHEGFDFKNFYNPLWTVSTSDGEYVNVTGLYPKEGAWSFSESSRNALPLTTGKQFQALNVPTYAYHNHTYTYYDRHQSHPNIWNNYKGLGNGLDVKAVWPESDLEMIQKTSAEYMRQERFHAYFMSVSGHLNYTWNGNSMSSKHHDEVKDLPYSELSKGYLAAQMEFDRAMEQLLADLKKYGQEDTLIVIAPDHYPYGLEKENIEELSQRKIDDDFDLYKSGVIIYSPMMEEKVEVKKVCSSIDILPTISNLLGFEYDSRLLMGVDVFGDIDPLVVLADGSFMNDEIRYDVKSGKATFLKHPMDEAKIRSIYNQAIKKLEISAQVLETDYYRYLNIHE